MSSQSLKLSQKKDIPEGWKKVEVGDHFNFKNGLNKAKKFFGQGTPIINYMDVYPHSSIEEENINGKVTLSNEELRNFGVRKGDVLFTRTSETIEEIGLSSVVLEDVKKTTFSGFLLRARPKTELFELEFTKYCFRSKKVRRQIISSSSQTTRALTNGKLLSKVFVLIPINSQEQKNIAINLSDIDELNRQLDDLIKKKKNIKQGAMQELLTGKRRLEGFTDKWIIKKLGDVLKVKHGKSQKEVEDENGQYPILATGGEIGKTSKYLYDKPSVLIGRKGTIDEPKYMDTPFWTVDTLFYTKILNDADPKFVFYKFMNIDWYSYNEASGVPSLNAKTIEKIEQLFPPTKEEQKIIVKILSDMDSEIKELEQKRDKYIMIKNGMMQKLLTGEIRLV